MQRVGQSLRDGKRRLVYPGFIATDPRAAGQFVDADHHPQLVLRDPHFQARFPQAAAE